MITRQDILANSSYWEQKIQLDIYNCACKFMETNNMNRTMLATHLGVSKSFVSQLLSGNYNYSLSKLIEISLKLGFQPDFTFKPIHLENSKSRISDTATVNTNQPVINT